MGHDTRKLAQIAVAEALKIRKTLSFDLQSPINVFDVCERLAVSVFFQGIPSMEGVYLPDAQPRPAIVVSSLRPIGRKAITCGHELGHHVFKHGWQWDELIEERSQTRRFEPEEFQADVFSACLQMPKTAVAYALARRGIDPNNCRGEDLFTLSTFFGVSYGALITHLERTLKLIGPSRAADLSRREPKELRESLLGETCPQNLVVADFNWEGRAIDVEVDDSLILPPEVKLEGASATPVSRTKLRTVVSAIHPGISRVSHLSGWCAFIRVMRKDYVGLAPFRFDEEVGDDV